MAPFTLSRATISDLPELCHLFYNCFRTYTTLRFMGCREDSLAEDISRFVSIQEKIMKSNPADFWIKVIDNETGKIIAATNWRLYLGTQESLDRKGDEVPWWLSEEDKERSLELIGPLNESRREFNKGPGLLLHICFTSKEYRRRGAGAMMLQWGNELADSLFLPCWVEASVDGTGLYKAFGYHETEVIQLGGEGNHTAQGMRRDARTKPIEGGRPAV